MIKDVIITFASGKWNKTTSALQRPVKRLQQPGYLRPKYEDTLSFHKVKVPQVVVSYDTFCHYMLN